MQILNIRKSFEAFQCKCDSKGIQSIQMQIRTIRKGFESFECKFEQVERNRSIRKQFEAF